jgi:hypothetical protein
VRIVEQAHQVVGHFGSQRTSDYIRRWYWWQRIYSDVEKYCRSCEICTRSKGECRAPVGKLHPLPIAMRPWESIGMDFIGLFLEVDGFNYSMGSYMQIIINGTLDTNKHKDNSNPVVINIYEGGGKATWTTIVDRV